MQFRKPTAAAWSARLIAVSLSGCAVYVPTVPSTPLVRQGQVELTTALRLSSLEAGAAWAPLPHVLLAGEAALQNGSGSPQTSTSTGTDYPSHHFQGGLGVGTYWLFGQHQAFYLGALGGVGVAKADLYDYTGQYLTTLLPLFGPPAAPVRFQATYWRYYGQLYVAQQINDKAIVGLSLRTTVVNYQQVLRNSRPVEYSPAQVFCEPHIFLRYGQGAVQGMTTFGYSFPTSQRLIDKELLTPATWLVSAGIVFRPASLGHKN